MIFVEEMGPSVIRLYDFEYVRNGLISFTIISKVTSC